MSDVQPTEVEIAAWSAAKTNIEEALEDNQRLTMSITGWAGVIAEWNKQQGFWRSENKGEKYALMHSELSEGFEGARKPNKDGSPQMSDKIPKFTCEEEELADTMIRIKDYAGHFRLRLEDAFLAKLEYNLTRPYMHGKAC